MTLRLLFGVATLMMIALPARAEDSPSNKAAAEVLFREGKALASKSDLDAACPKFAESQRLDPKPGTLVHLATCHELQGKTATAWVEWTEAIDVCGRAKQADREKLAREHAAALERELSHVSFIVPIPYEGLVVEMDGARITRALDKIPVDPGAHQVRAYAPSYQPFSLEVTIRPHESLAVTIPTLAPLAPPVLEAPPKPVHREPPLNREGASSARTTIGVVLIGLGVVGVAGGSFFGLRAASLKSDSDPLCPNNQCSADGLALFQDAERSATLSTVAFSVGLVALGAGAYFLLTSKNSRY